MPTKQAISDWANDKMTPEWSHQLARAVNSPLLAQNYEAREKFVSQVTQYATYDETPPRLQEVYRRAMASYGETPSNS